MKKTEPIPQVQRNTNKRLIATTFVITILVFLVGMLVGFLAVGNTNTALQDELDQLKSHTFVLELLTLQSASDYAQDLCPFYEEQFKAYDAQTAEFWKKLAFVEKNVEPGDERMQILQNDYSLMQARDYFLIHNINKKCAKKINLVLFFTQDNCNECNAQLEVLAQAKREANFTVMLYTFNLDTARPEVKALKMLYGVQKAPALIINEQAYKTPLTAYEVNKLLYKA